MSGHTHRVESEERDGVLHLNPGSAGPERFGHQRTLARLHNPGGAEEAPPAQGDAAAQVGVEFLLAPEGYRLLATWVVSWPSRWV